MFLTEAVPGKPAEVCRQWTRGRDVEDQSLSTGERVCLTGKRGGRPGLHVVIPDEAGPGRREQGQFIGCGDNDDWRVQGA